MQYVLLKTVYHKDRAKYQALYEKRFQGEETVHLPITIGKSPAFYCITGELLDIVYDIAMLNTRIFQIDAELPPIARDQFISSCLINEVAMTNRIEGIHSSRKEIGELLEGIRGTKNEDTLLGLIRIALLRVERIRSLGEYILTDYFGKVKYYKVNLEFLDQALS